MREYMKSQILEYVFFGLIVLSIINVVIMTAGCA